MVLRISSIAAPKVTLKSTLKFKSIKALKPRVAAKPKLIKVIKYKDKTTKLYTSYIYNIKTLAIRSRQDIKFKSKLSKIIIFISGKESLSSNNTSIKNNNKDKLIEV